MKQARISFYSFLLCSSFLIACNLNFHPWTSQGYGVLNWDVYGYYLYLPAFFYDDPAQLNNVDSIQKKYHPTQGFYQAFKAPNGNYVMKYSSGQAIMYLPFFAIAHICAKTFDYPADGFSLPYQAAISLESVLIAILGLWFLRKILRRYFNEVVTAVILIIMVFASNYLTYTAFVGAFPHNYLFTLYAIIIERSIRWYEKPSGTLSASLGIFCGLAALTRPTEIMCALIPLLWGTTNLKARFIFLRSHAQQILLFILCALAVGSVQLIYWKVYAGTWLYFSYGEDQTFSWLNPHFYSVLFTYKKGWLVYTPVMSLAILGLPFLWWKHRTLFTVVIVFFLVALYTTSAWDNWMFGGSFSMRGLVQYYPVVAFPIASIVEFFIGRKFLSVLMVLFVSFCIWLNLQMTWQVFYSTQGIISGYSMSPKYFWKVFGKTHINIDDRKFMDTNEELPSSLEKKLLTVLFTDMENDTAVFNTPVVHSGKKAWLINEQLPISPILKYPIQSDQKSWYRITAWVYAPMMEWNEWKQTHFSVSLWNNDERLKEKSYRIYNVIEPGAWQKIFIDINGTKLKDYNNLRVHFWNSGSTLPVFIDDITIERATVE